MSASSLSQADSEKVDDYTAWDTQYSLSCSTFEVDASTRRGRKCASGTDPVRQGRRPQ